MALTKDLGPFYGHAIFYRLKPKGFIERAYSQEIDGEYRKGFGLAFRLPFTCHGLVLGVWRKTGYTERQALSAAIGGRGLKRDEKEAWDRIRHGVEECLEENQQNEQSLK